MFHFEKLQDCIRKYREDLIKIWTEGFEDPPDYVDFFLDHCPEGTLVGLDIQAGTLVSACYFIPAGTTPEGSSVLYLYAAAVLPAFRGKGIWRQGCREALRSLTESGTPGIVVFSMPDLRKFYDKQEYDHTYSHFRFDQEADTGMPPDAGNGSGLNAAGLEVSELAAERQKFLCGLNVPFLTFSGEYLRYVKEEKAYCGNPFDKLLIGRESYYLVGNRNGDTLEIEETNLLPDQAFHYRNELFKQYRVKHLEIRYPVSEKTVWTDSKEGTAEGRVYGGQGTFGEENFWFPFSLC